ncbi:MAG: hypothetical protein A2W31_11715 [Planctomycetes bacterium RBG_16_64_10]|nr:MAG: hypothetical protein A2W31_11715 [Planctomycetes bacterium RBG_16_64_10]
MTMAYSGVLDDVRTCIHLGRPARVPVFALGEMFNARVAGITWAEYTNDLGKLVACEIAAVQQFDYDWVYLNPDDNVEFEPLGVKTRGSDFVPLAAYEFLPASWEALGKLRLPAFQRTGRMPAFLAAISQIKRRLRDTICLTSRVAAPFSSVALLYGTQVAMMMLVEQPELFRSTAAFFVDMMSAWGRAQIRAGADAIWVGDCVASSHFISPAHYADYAAHAAMALNSALRNDGAIVFYHAGESALPHLELMADTGPDALSIGGGIDIKHAKETVGKRICLLGNIRGMETLQSGSPAHVAQETRRIMEAGKQHGGFIFNSEEGIPYQTPEENIRVMMATAKQHARY